MKWPSFVLVWVLLMTCASTLGAQTPEGVQVPESIASSAQDPESKEDRIDQDRKVKNLRAFAKLFGHVRYFHPSDEVKTVDWLKFAVHGAATIHDAPDDNELVRRLEALFSPLAPTLQFYKEGSPPPSTPSTSATSTKEDRAAVTWQHKGPGGNNRGFYRSYRLGDLPTRLTNEIWLQLEDQPFEGQHFRLTARAKADIAARGVGASVYLFARNADGQTFFEDLMRDRLITGEKWQTYEVTGTFDEAPAYIEIGAELLGNGQAWFDDFAFSVSDDGESWRPVQLENSRFDQAEEDGFPTGWRTNKHEFLSYQVAKADEESVLHLKSLVDHAPGQLFDRYAKLGEYVDEPTAGGLRYRFPLALLAVQLANENPSFEALQAVLAGIDTSVVDNTKVENRMANIVHTWTILQHFYPYFEWASADWDETLDVTIADALGDRSERDFFDTLRRMIAKLEDGHGVVQFRSLPNWGGLPIAVSWIENQVVVTASDSDLFKPGDIISKIDGKSGEEFLIEAEQYTSGSPHLRRFRTLNQFGQGEIGSTAQLEVIRAGSKVEFSYPREEEKRGFFFNSISPFDFPDIEEIEDGIYYVNTQSIKKADYQAQLQDLASAKAVIFDSRWDGVGTDPDGFHLIHDVIAHLIEEPATSANWLIPEVIYPDQADLTFNHSTWDIEPAEPHFEGKAIFINTPPEVSFGETVMAFVVHYDLGVTVGGTTAGCNGNVKFIDLIGGDSVWFTGMKVLNQDGSRLHLIGYEPDYPVARTIDGVAAGRDEYLEEALRLARQ